MFLACVAYLVSQFRSGPVDSGAQSEPSILNAFMALVAFGLPSAYYALFGRFRGAPEANDPEAN